MKRIAVIFHRFGPYHYARLNAAGKDQEIVGIELSAQTADDRDQRDRGSPLK